MSKIPRLVGRCLGWCGWDGGGRIARSPLLERKGRGSIVPWCTNIIRSDGSWYRGVADPPGSVKRYEPPRRELLRRCVASFRARRVCGRSAATHNFTERHPFRCAAGMHWPKCCKFPNLVCGSHTLFLSTSQRGFRSLATGLVNTTHCLMFQTAKVVGKI